MEGRRWERKETADGDIWSSGNINGEMVESNTTTTGNIMNRKERIERRYTLW